MCATDGRRGTDLLADHRRARGAKAGVRTPPDGKRAGGGLRAGRIPAGAVEATPTHAPAWPLVQSRRSGTANTRPTGTALHLRAKSADTKLTARSVRGRALGSAAWSAASLRIATATVDPRTVSPVGRVWLPLPTRTGHQVRLADLDDAITDPWLAYRQEQARKRREVAECDRTYRDDQDDDEDPIPEGPAPQVSGEVNRRYGGPSHWASGRTAR